MYSAPMDMLTDGWSEYDVRLPDYLNVDGGLFWLNTSLW